MKRIVSIVWVGKQLPSVEKLINRTRDRDWLFGGWSTLNIGSWSVAGLAEPQTYVYGKAECQPIPHVVTVALALFAGVLFVVYLLARFRSPRKANGVSGIAPSPAVAGTEPPLMMKFGTAPDIGAIDPHGGEGR